MGKSMVIDIENLVNNWSTGCTKNNIRTNMLSLRDLTEEGHLGIIWKKGVNNTVNMFTKNLTGQ